MGLHTRSRGCATLVAILLAAIWGPTSAAEPILARVLSIDEDAIRLAPVDDDAGTGEVIRLPRETADGSDGIAPGSLVRYWPVDSAPGHTVGARVVPLHAASGTPDRTGVRARLMYGAERGFGRMRNGR